MSADRDRPNKRLVQGRLRQLLDPVRDFLEESPDVEGFLPGEEIPFSSGGEKWRIVCRAVRVLDGPPPPGAEYVQRPLPFSELQARRDAEPAATAEATDTADATAAPRRAVTIGKAHRAVLAAATPEPKTGARLFRDAGYAVPRGKLHSGQRQILADLLHLELLHRPGKNQYRLPPAKPQAS